MTLTPAPARGTAEEATSCGSVPRDSEAACLPGCGCCRLGLGRPSDENTRLYVRLSTILTLSVSLSGALQKGGKLTIHLTLYGFGVVLHPYFEVFVVT
jgi:hypothetical protein